MLARFTGYAIVGAVGALLHYALTIVFVERFGVGVLGASTIGFVAALCTQFALNRRWVFRSRSGALASFVRYAATSVWGLLLNLAVLFVTTSVLGWHYLIGAAIAIAVVTPCNFLLNQYWTFGSATRGR